MHGVTSIQVYFGFLEFFVLFLYFVCYCITCTTKVDDIFFLSQTFKYVLFRVNDYREECDPIAA